MKVVGFEAGLYSCDTLFIEVAKDKVVQIPVDKSAKASEKLIGKKIKIEYLDKNAKTFDVPLKEIVII